jgi:hypothetical protein
MKSFVVIVASFAAALLAGMAGARAADTQLPLPDVHVTAPGPTNTPPYLREPGRAASNPYHGRFRVEEDRFVPVPCAQTRIASSAGGTCLSGYKLTPGIALCDMSLDVVSFENARVSVEADILIFDPYKIVADSPTGHQPKNCYVKGYLNYDEVDFQDMNQVTRRGTNFRNPVGSGDDKSIEFEDGPHHCKAIRHTGPEWHGGYIYIGHVSICRKDAARVQADDIAYVYGTLRVRMYDPEGNLRAADQNDAPVAPIARTPQQ